MKQPRRHVDVFLCAGQLAVHAVPVTIKTILGSCVAVCLWDRQRRIGGVNHFLLPRPGPGDVPDLRFGSVATVRLIEELCHAGATLSGLEAAVVGGGSPLPAIKLAAVGCDNVAVALAVLHSRRIAVVRQDTGGAYGRKLLFDTRTGELLVRRLRGVPAAVGQGVGA
jgi:chemotaxis protein CheD